MRPSVAMPVRRPSAVTLTPTLPSWVAGLFPATPPTADRGVTVMEGAGFTLVSGVLAKARSLDSAGLRGAVADLYARAGDALRATRAAHLVRAWNFIPGIHEALGDGLTRYFVFNQGRFDAFTRWLGGPGAFASGLPTATGVGHEGDDLALHFLGSARPGRPVENPRQCPAYRYSPRHGPRPPCFARATRVRLPAGDSLLIGGTAAVKGEESMHPGSLGAQIDETMQNLAALLAAAGAASLGAVTQARVYFLRPADRGPLASIAGRFHPACEVEYVRADICRGELLVEIEGLARVPGQGA